MIELLAASHVKLVTLVLLYIFSGEVKLETRAFESDIDCKIAAAQRVEEIQKDPRFDGGFGAWCVELPGQKS